MYTGVINYMQTIVQGFIHVYVHVHVHVLYMAVEDLDLRLDLIKI